MPSLPATPRKLNIPTGPVTPAAAPHCPTNKLETRPKRLTNIKTNILIDALAPSYKAPKNPCLAMPPSIKETPKGPSPEGGATLGVTLITKSPAPLVTFKRTLLPRFVSTYAINSSTFLKSPSLSPRCKPARSAGLLLPTFPMNTDGWTPIINTAEIANHPIKRFITAPATTTSDFLKAERLWKLLVLSSVASLGFSP